LERPFKKFASREQFTENVFFNNYRPRLSPVSMKDIRKLIASCWDKDPNERPGMSQVVKTLRVETALSGLGLMGNASTSSRNKLQLSASQNSMLRRSFARASSAAKHTATRASMQADISEDFLNLDGTSKTTPSLGISKVFSYDKIAPSPADTTAQLLLRSSSKNSLSNDTSTLSRHSNLTRGAQSAGILGMNTKQVASMSNTNSKNFSWDKDASGCKALSSALPAGGALLPRRTLSKNSQLCKNALIKHSNLSHDSLLNGEIEPSESSNKNFSWQNNASTGGRPSTSGVRYLQRSSSSNLSLSSLNGGTHSNASTSSLLSNDASASSIMSSDYSFGGSEFTFGRLSSPVQRNKESKEGVIQPTADVDG
jgi:hypothetical protein